MLHNCIDTKETSCIPKWESLTIDERKQIKQADDRINQLAQQEAEKNKKTAAAEKKRIEEEKQEEKQEEKLAQAEAQRQEWKKLLAAEERKSNLKEVKGREVRPIMYDPSLAAKAKKALAGSQLMKKLEKIEQDGRKRQEKIEQDARKQREKNEQETRKLQKEFELARARYRYRM